MGTRLGTFQTGTTYPSGYGTWRLVLEGDEDNEDADDTDDDDDADDDQDESADGESSDQYEENYGVWHPDTVRAYGIWGLRIPLVICGTILACLNHKEEAEACGTGLLFSFFFL